MHVARTCSPTRLPVCLLASLPSVVLPACLQDLLTDEPFTRKDILHLQDPLNVSGRLISEFHHVRFVSTVAPGWIY